MAASVKRKISPSSTSGNLSALLPGALIGGLFSYFSCLSSAAESPVSENSSAESTLATKSVENTGYLSSYFCDCENADQQVLLEAVLFERAFQTAYRYQSDSQACLALRLLKDILPDLERVETKLKDSQRCESEFEDDLSSATEREILRVEEIKKSLADCQSELSVFASPLPPHAQESKKQRLAQFVKLTNDLVLDKIAPNYGQTSSEHRALAAILQWQLATPCIYERMTPISHLSGTTNERMRAHLHDWKKILNELIEELDQLSPPLQEKSPFLHPRLTSSIKESDKLLDILKRMDQFNQGLEAYRSIETLSKGTATGPRPNRWLS